MFGPIWLWLALFSTVLVLVGCSTTPNLTAEQRKKDIEYLAQWAKDYSPFVELNEKHKGNPSYEALLPKYLEYAEQAQTNEQFCKVVRGYYDLICSTGHHYLVPEGELKWGKIAMILGIIDLDINPFTSDQALYWSRLARTVTDCAHPPFDIVLKEGKHLTDSDWQVDGITVPRGSQIIKVNGMNCSSYLDFLKEDTFLRYWAWAPPNDRIRERLLILNEGPDFTGWQVDFLLPDGSVQHAFVPKLKQCPGPKIRTVEPKENCTCIELTDDVGYVRIKSFTLSPLDLVFSGFVKRDRKKIKAFLDRSRGKYSKLIIDIRNNGGGLPYYGYDNLIEPFLDEPVTYHQVAGIRKKYKDDLKKSVLKTIRRWCSTKKEYVVNTEQIDAPEGFDSKQWVFYRLTRTIEPRNRYSFDGNLYILVNGGTFSAGDDYANAVKRIGFAKLVGTNTGGGCAAYIGPPILRLPESGMIFRVETELVINPDGSFNELFGTPPDVELPGADPPKSITKENLLKDEWIKKVITDL